MPTLPLEGLQLKRDQIKAQLAQIRDMRAGSLVERYRKCGKSSCHCARKDARGHGPSFSLTRPVRGKTITRIIPRGEAVEQTRAQISDGRPYHDGVASCGTLRNVTCPLLGSEDAAGDQGMFR